MERRGLECWGRWWWGRGGCHALDPHAQNKMVFRLSRGNFPDDIFLTEFSLLRVKRSLCRVAKNTRQPFEGQSESFSKSDEI